MAPAVVGNHIGMTALNTGPLLSRMLVKKLVEKPEKGKNRYQITRKGEELLAKPPEEIPPPPKVPKDDSVIPSQADIFRSIAEQLSISKAEEAKGGTPLEGIINFVERTADMDDLNSLWNAGQVY